MFNSVRAVLVLGLIIALSLALATSAQAEGETRIGGKTFAELKIEEESFTGNLSGEGFTLLVAAELPFQIKCKKFSPNSGTLYLVGGIEVSFTIDECTVLEDSSPLLGEISCTVAPIEIKAAGELTSSGGSTYVLLLPSSESSFGEVKLSGGFCTLVGNYPLKGSFAAQVGPESEKLELSINSKTSESALGDGLTFNGSKAFLTGALTISLNGANTGKTILMSPTIQGGEFRIEGKSFAALGIEEESVTGSGTFSFLVPQHGYEINCAAVSVLEGTLLLKGSSNISFELSECTALNYKTKAEFKFCAVENFTTELTTSVFLTGGKVFILFTPLSEAFTTLEIEALGCALFEIMELMGTFAAEVGAEASLQELVLVDQATAASFGDHIKMSQVEFYTDGTLFLELSEGKYKGKKWGAI